MGCGGVGVLGSMCVAWSRILEGGWCYVSVGCESELCVEMAGPGICVRRILAHLRSAQCSILLHLIDIGFLRSLYVADIANPDFLEDCC